MKGLSGIPGMGDTGDDASNADMSDSSCGDVVIVVEEHRGIGLFSLIGAFAVASVGYMIGRSS